MDGRPRARGRTGHDPWTTPCRTRDGTGTDRGIAEPSTVHRSCQRSPPRQRPQPTRPADQRRRHPSTLCTGLTTTTGFLSLSLLLQTRRVDGTRRGLTIRAHGVVGRSGRPAPPGAGPAWKLSGEGSTVSLPANPDPDLVPAAPPPPAPGRHGTAAAGRASGPRRSTAVPSTVRPSGRGRGATGEGP